MTRSRLPVVAAAVLGSFVVTYAATASMLFVPDSDTATLVSILANGIKQLDALNQEIGQVTKVYSQTKQLVGHFRVLGREIVLGTVIVGLIQGVLAGAAYFVLHVPQPAFFGAMTAVASVLPAIGTTLVWAPIGVYLITTGHVGAGVADLVWGAFIVVTFADGILRPKLVGERSKMGLLPSLIGLFGGVELFGFIGLLLGPTLVGMSLAILRLYAQERGRRHQHINEALSAGVPVELT